MFAIHILMTISGICGDGTNIYGGFRYELAESVVGLLWTEMEVGMLFNADHTGLT